MQAAALEQEAHTLLDMVANKQCTLAESILEMDVAEYSDPSRFEREKYTLFRDHAQFVGPSCLLPEAGDHFAFDDTGIPLLVVRKENGKLAAYVNICSHRGAPLAQGFGKAQKGRLLSCPYHGWRYNLNGELTAIPQGKQGFGDLDRAAHGLRPVQVGERDGCIFVMPNPELGFDIEDTLGGLGPQLSGFGLSDHHLLGTKRVETDMNWKLNLDTFQEFYHFDALHPDTIAQMSHGNICHYEKFGRNHSMSSPTLQIDELRQQEPQYWQPRKYVSFVIYLFPNTVLFVVEDHFQTWRVYPLSHKRSVVYHSMYLPEPPKNEAERIEKENYFQMINDVAVTEDYALVERIQRGINADLDRTVIIGRNEPGVQNMHRQIQDIMNTHRRPA
ncbi:MAG: aromatic ring-hydroxylating dioxygenase subunit alpha [Halioglobus sp.]